jgi:hypothetical protein
MTSYDVRALSFLRFCDVMLSTSSMSFSDGPTHIFGDQDKRGPGIPSGPSHVAHPIWSQAIGVRDWPAGPWKTGTERHGSSNSFRVWHGAANCGGLEGKAAQIALAAGAVEIPAAPPLAPASTGPLLAWLCPSLPGRCPGPPTLRADARHPQRARSACCHSKISSSSSSSGSVLSLLVPLPTHPWPQAPDCP